MSLLVALLLIVVNISLSWGYRICLSANCGLRRSILTAHSSDFSTGMTLEIDGSPMEVLEYTHIKMARSSAVIRTKLKNMITGSLLERTFRPGDTLPECDIVKHDVEYSHSDGVNIVFRDIDDDEDEISVPKIIVKNPQLLSEGLECTLMKWNDKVVEVRLPAKMEFEVVDVSSGSGTSKTAGLDCGLDVSVPSFIKVGEKIIITSEDLKYSSRAEKFSVDFSGR